MTLDLYDLRRREVQALGAALSCGDWHMMEQAYNSLRDKLDKAGFSVGALQSIEAGAGKLAEVWEGPAYEYGVTWGPEEAHPDRHLQVREQAIREAGDALLAYVKRMNRAGKEASFLDAHRIILGLAALTTPAGGIAEGGR